MIVTAPATGEEGVVPPPSSSLEVEEVEKEEENVDVGVEGGSDGMIGAFLSWGWGRLVARWAPTGPFPLPPWTSLWLIEGVGRWGWLAVGVTVIVTSTCGASIRVRLLW